MSGRWVWNGELCENGTCTWGEWNKQQLITKQPGGPIPSIEHLLLVAAGQDGESSWWPLKACGGRERPNHCHCSSLTVYLTTYSCELTQLTSTHSSLASGVLLPVRSPQASPRNAQSPTNTFAWAYIHIHSCCEGMYWKTVQCAV